jgi:hypothetical protein
VVRSCRLSSEVSESFEVEYREERRRPFDEMINLEGIDFNRQKKKAKEARRKKQLSNSSPIPIVPFIPKALPSRGRLL